MTRRARVVVVGAGIAGSSAAYHLAELGWTDVLVLDQGEPASGSTAHSPGLVSQLDSSASATRLLVHSASLYKRLKLGAERGFLETGSVRLACSSERLLELKRQHSLARAAGLEARLLAPHEAKELFPLMSLAGVHGALHLPSDGSARAVVLAKTLAAAAEARGVEFLAHAKVVGFEIKEGRVCGVRTPQQDVSCELVVLAAGLWSAALGRLAGARVPLIAMHHQYAVTEPLAEIKALGAKTLPNLRDPDHLVYCRQDGEALVVGGYERRPAPYYHEQPPESADSTLQGFSPARFESLWKGGVESVPALAKAVLARKVNALEAFTPDGEFLLGPAPEPAGLWLACGFCARGVSAAGGAGRLLAEWIVSGEPSLDLRRMDVRRFGAHATRPGYVAARACESYAAHDDIAYPGRERRSRPGLKRSPMHEKLAALACVFGEKSGWERPVWLAHNEALPAARAAPVPRGWAAKNWSPAIAAEHAACRETAALFDATSASKLEVSGRGALGFLQRLADNQLDRPEGSLTRAQLLNERGGVECDLAVARLAKDRFRLLAGAAFGVRDAAWLARHRPTGGSVTLRDVTDEECCLGVWGPRARALLQAVSSDDLSDAAFPCMTARRIRVGAISVLAARAIRAGEPGWELYAPMKEGGKLWDALWEAGRPLGAAAAGCRAADSLRLEAGARGTADIDSEHDPFEAGLDSCVRLDKSDFLGRAALLERKARGLTRKLCCLTLEDKRAAALGGEAVSLHARVLGRVTSAGFGWTVGESIACAYLPVVHAEPGQRLDIELFGERVPAVVRREPLYDPAGARVTA